MKNIKKRLIEWTLGLALSLGVGIGIASNTHSEITGVEAAGETTVATLTFPDENKANNAVSVYDTTWTAKIGTNTWSISNFNNNRWGNNWTYIKCGSKNATSVATITNATPLEGVSKIALKIGAMTVSNVNRVYLQCGKTDTTITENEIALDSLKTGVHFFEVGSSDFRFFKLTFDCKKGSKNGIVQVDSVEYSKIDENAHSVTISGPQSVEPSKSIQLSATCSKGDKITWSCEPESVATVSETGMVTGVSEGTATVTATCAGAGTATYSINVFDYTGDGTIENPFTVADAINKATVAGGTATAETYFVKGKIAKIDTAFNSTFGNMTFSVSDDGSTENVFQFYRCVADKNVKFTADSSKTIVVGEEILGCGKILSYNGTPEFEADCYPYDYKATSISATEPTASGLKIGDIISSVSQLGITVTADIEITGEKRDVTAEATVEPATLVDGENTITVKYTQTNKYSGVTTNNTELTTTVIVNVTTTEATDMAIVANSTTIYAGETTILKATLSGGTNNYQRTIGWTSSDTTVIANPENSVDGAEFVITGLKEGTTTITGTVVAPGSATASVTITVKPARTETDIALHGKMLKTEYNVGDKWDLTGLDLEVSWSDGSTTFVELNDEKVLTNCKPGTVTNVSLTSFALEIVYVGKADFTKEFTIDGFTVAEVLEEKYDFVSGFGIYASKWESSYSKHQLTHSDLGSTIEADVELTGSKQTTNITDKPVFKGAANEVVIDFTLQKAGYIIKHVDIEFVQWTTKTPTMSLYKGVYSAGSSKINSLTIGKDNLVLSGDVNDSRFQVCTSGDNQVGLSSIMITYVKDSGLLNEALAFGTSFLNKTAEACTDGTNDNSEALKAAWTTLKNEFTALSDGAKKLVKGAAANNAGTDLEKAMARYDHIVKRYSAAHAEINDFIGRGVTTSLTNQLFKANTINNIMVISLIACASAAAIGSFFFIRKRKEQN